jgi:hypothetical protein
VISRNRRRSPVRGRSRPRGAPARRWAQPRSPGRARHDGPDRGRIARATLFGAAAFVFVYVLTIAVVASLLDVVAPLNRPGAAARANWLVIPLELGGMFGAFLGALLAGWVLAEADGDRSTFRLVVWSMAGPVAIAFLLLAVGGFEGGPLRALLDMAVVAAGAWVGSLLIVRRAVPS